MAENKKNKIQRSKELWEELTARPCKWLSIDTLNEKWKK